MEAERGLAARGQDTRGATELRRIAVRGGAAPAPPQAQPHLALASHLQKDWDHRAGLGGCPVQVPPPSVLANQLQREGSSGRQKRGR